MLRVKSLSEASTLNWGCWGGGSSVSESVTGKVGLCFLPSGNSVPEFSLRAERITQGPSFGISERAVEHVRLDGLISPFSLPGGEGIRVNGLLVYASGVADIPYKNGNQNWMSKVWASNVGNSAYLLIQGYRPGDEGRQSSKTLYWERMDRGSSRFYYGRFDYQGIQTVMGFDERLMADGWATLLTTRPTRWTTTCRSVKLQPENIDKEDVVSLVEKLLNRVDYLPTSPDAERAIYRSALIGQKSFNGNLINYASKIGGLGTSIRASMELLGSPEDPKKWASFWLANRFSDRLMLQNTKQLLQGLESELRANRLGVQISRASSSEDVGQVFGIFTECTCLHNAKLVCSNESENQLMSAVKKLYEWDAFPTLENAWDLVPFSFVVDWFANFGTILDNIDTMVYNQYLRVQYYLRSDKYRAKVSPDWISKVLRTSLTGDINYTFYRRYPAEIPDLGILDQWEPSIPSPTNVVDLTALAVQLFG